MGITVKKTLEYECDRCNKKVDDYFGGNYSLPMGGDGRDVTYTGEVTLKYVVAYAGSQIVCHKCAADILRNVAEKLDEMS